MHRKKVSVCPILAKRRSRSGLMDQTLTYRYIVRSDKDHLQLNLTPLDEDYKWQMKITNEGKDPVVIICISWVVGKRKKSIKLGVSFYNSLGDSRWPNTDINKIHPGRTCPAIFSVDDLKDNLRGRSNRQFETLRIEFRTGRRRIHKIFPNNDLLREIKKDLPASAES